MGSSGVAGQERGNPHACFPALSGGIRPPDGVQLLRAPCNPYRLPFMKEERIGRRRSGQGEFAGPDCVREAGYTVSASGFGPVHRLIRLPLDLMHRFCAGATAGDADRGGDPQRFVGADRRHQVFRSEPQFFREPGRCFDIGGGREDRKLFAADPPQDIAAADVAFECRGDRLQHRIAGGVAMLVVD